MADIVISEFMDEAVVKDCFKGREVLFDPALVDDSARLLEAVGDARALIVRNRTQVREELLQAAAKLRVVGRLGVGLDNIDLAACERRGVKVLPATGANDTAVAEYVITAALLLLRRAWQAGAEVIAGRWPRQESIGAEISGKRLGLIGFGGIARETAKRALALGMRVCACDPYLPEDDPNWSGVERQNFQEVLAAADALSLHVPLTDETRHLIDAAALKKMQPHALLINTSRGGIVDEAALRRALADGRLGGAALDVFEAEPLDAERGRVFEDTPNLILTPHIAGVTEESNVRVSRVTAENVLGVLGWGAGYTWGRAQAGRRG